MNMSPKQYTLLETTITKAFELYLIFLYNFWEPRNNKQSEFFCKTNLGKNRQFSLNSVLYQVLLKFIVIVFIFHVPFVYEIHSFKYLSK